MYAKKPFGIEKGDVVLVSFPYQDGAQVRARLRPAVVVSNAVRNEICEDVLLIPLIRPKQYPDCNSQVVVKMNSSQGRAAGLRGDSLIDCTVIATIPKQLLLQRIGAFPSDIMAKVDDCIRWSLDL